MALGRLGSSEPIWTPMRDREIASGQVTTKVCHSDSLQRERPDRR